MPWISVPDAAFLISGINSSRSCEIDSPRSCACLISSFPKISFAPGMADRLLIVERVSRNVLALHSRAARILTTKRRLYSGTTGGVGVRCFLAHFLVFDSVESSFFPSAGAEVASSVFSATFSWALVSVVAPTSGCASGLAELGSAMLVSSV